MSNIYINQKILQKLKEKERSIACLARQVGYDRDNLRKILKNNHGIHADLLFNVSIALEEDFFICYSQEFKERIKENEKRENQNK